MDYLSDLTVPMGDPANVALRWAIAALIVVIAWLVISFLFLPFFYGIRALVMGLVTHIANAVRWLFGRADAQISAVRGAYEDIALIGNLKSLLVDQLEQLRQTAKSAATSVNASLYRFRSAGGGGAGATLMRLNAELKRLGGVQSVGPPHEDAYRQRGMALLRAMLFTIFAIALMVVNTALLNEFFRSLIRVQVPVFGITISVALVVSLLYTLVEFALGLALEVFNDRDNSATQRFNAPAAMVIFFILIALLVEVGLYAILSFSINWPWPDSVRGSLPTWIDGWLALMGLLIGGGVAISGYLVGDQWSKVIKFNAYKSMAKQAHLLNRALQEFKGGIPELRRKAGLDEGGESAAAETAKPTPTALRAEQNAVAVVDALEQVQAADISAMATCSPGDANWRRSVSLLFLIMAALFVSGNVLLQADFLRTTALGRIFAWAPFAFAAIMAAAMVLFGWLGATRLQATRIGRGGDDVAERFEVRDHGLGVAQISGLVGALVVMAFGVSLASRGFSSFDTVLILASVGLNLATFAVGALAESVASAIVFCFKFIWNIALSAVYAVFGLITGAGWLVLRIVEVAAAFVAAPAVWLISFFRGRKGPGAPVFGGAATMQRGQLEGSA